MWALYTYAQIYAKYNVECAKVYCVSKCAIHISHFNYLFVLTLCCSFHVAL